LIGINPLNVVDKVDPLFDDGTIIDSLLAKLDPLVLLLKLAMALLSLLLVVMLPLALVRLLLAVVKFVELDDEVDVEWLLVGWCC